MSDIAQGPDWWLASDGKWYPPTSRFPLPPPPGSFPPQPVQTNGLAVASMVFGILWIFCIGSILALVFGYRARRAINASGGTQSGGGMAIAGIVLGWVGLVLLGPLVVISLLGTTAEPTFTPIGEQIE